MYNLSMEKTEIIGSVKIYRDGTAFVTDVDHVVIYCERKYAIMASVLIGSGMQAKAVLDENGGVVNIII